MRKKEVEGREEGEGSDVAVTYDPMFTLHYCNTTNKL